MFLFLISVFCFLPPAFADNRVTIEQAEALVGKALTDEGIEGTLRVTLFGNRRQDLARGANIETAVQELAYDKTSGHVSAMLVFISNGTNLTPLRVQGRYEEMTEVPVLRGQLRRGEVIAERDVETALVPLARTKAGIVTDINDLIGQSPRQTISAGRPVRTSEITAATAVKKGAVVTLQYVQRNMVVSAQGETMEDGAVGESIRVRNLTSKAIVHGVVESADVVTVKPLATP